MKVTYEGRRVFQLSINQTLLFFLEKKKSNIRKYIKEIKRKHRSVLSWVVGSCTTPTQHSNIRHLLPLYIYIYSFRVFLVKFFHLGGEDHRYINGSKCIFKFNQNFYIQYSKYDNFFFLNRTYLILDVLFVKKNYVEQ